MITVKVLTSNPTVPHIKMTPGSKGVIEDFQFITDKPSEKADWLVVVDGIPTKETLICPKENTILITQETEVVKKYNPSYVKQFNWVITSQKSIDHPRQIFTQQGHQSYLFMRRKSPDQSIEEYQNQFKTFDELRAMKEIPKSKDLVTVVSHKLRTDGARNRHAFIMKLKDHFKGKFDIYTNKEASDPENVFGSDSKTSAYKWDAVSPYKYVLSIENSYVPHWWTNHLFDAWLAGCYPIFYGHPSILEYFPKNSLALIDINDPDSAIKIIEKAMSENYFEKYQKEIWEARNLVLNKYYLFAMIKDVIKTLPPSNKYRQITIKPEGKPWVIKKIVSILKGKGWLYSIPRYIFRKYRQVRYGITK